MQKRVNVVATLVGGRGTGKTTFLLGDESIKVKGLVKPYLDRGMKVLIIDTFDHPAYRNIRRIASKDIPRWKSGIYRIYGEEFNTIFDNVNKYLTNTFIVFEDARKYIHKVVPQHVIQFIIDSKQKNLDMLFMYHDWGWVPVDLFRMCDFFEVFKTKTHIRCRKTHLSNYEQMLRVYEKVSAHPSQFYHESVETGD